LNGTLVLTANPSGGEDGSPTVLAPEGPGAGGSEFGVPDARKRKASLGGGEDR